MQKEINLYGVLFHNFKNMYKYPIYPKFDHNNQTIIKTLEQIGTPFLARSKDSKCTDPEEIALNLGIYLTTSSVKEIIKQSLENKIELAVGLSGNIITSENQLKKYSFHELDRNILKAGKNKGKFIYSNAHFYLI